MKIIIGKLSLLLLAILLSACGSSTPEPTPIPPLPDTIAPSLTALATALNPASPASVSPEAIQISEPGPNSTLATNFLIAGQADPTFEQTLIVRMAGINGLQVILQPVSIQADIGQAGPFSTGGVFNILAELPARISVYDISARDGGLIHLASVQVTLLPSGTSIINPPPPPNEVIDIFTPAHLAEISGGMLTLSGFSEYFFEGNLNVTLCGPGGSGVQHQICGTVDNVLAESFATIISPDVGIPGPFSAELAYSVSTSTPARIVVYAISPMDGAIIHLSSQEITLNP